MYRMFIENVKKKLDKGKSFNYNLGKRKKGLYDGS